MADLKLEVDYSQVGKAANSLGQLEGVAKSMGTALARGKITQSQYMAEMNKLATNAKRLGLNVGEVRSQLMRKVSATKQAIQFNDLLAASEERLGIATTRSSRGMNRMGVVTQQAGYQIGDFLVQVQSGTNPMVAFGQQATQLAGVMTLFGGKMVLIGTILGVAIPLFTAVAAGIMRTRGAADSATGGFTTMEAAMKAAREESTRMADEIERLNRGLKDNTQLNVARAIEQQQLRVTEAQAIADQVAGTDGGFVAEQRLAREQETLRQYEAQLQKLKDQAQEIDNINDSREQELERAKEQIELQEQYRESLRRTQRQQLEALLEAGRVAEEGRQTREDIARTLEREVELYREIARFGEDSAQVEALRAQQARDAHLARIQETTTNEVLIRQAMERYDAMVELRGESEDTKDALEELAGLNLGSLRAEIDFLIRRLNIGEEAARAMALAMPIGASGGDAARGGRGMTLGMGGRRPNFDMDLGIGRYADKPERGGKVDPLAQLRERLALEKELLGKSEAQQRIIQALGINWRSYGEDTVNSLVASIEEMDRFNERVQQQQQLADSIANSFGDAFMSIVDGTKFTKDAFKQMAAAIVRDLYQVYVMKRLIGSAEAGTGIAGAIGRLIGGRESGGSMMANRPYLVGERGPELVIPGRSATVTNADLTRKSMGGSDAVNVVNNINVTGGTDPAAIRQEVAKLMPQITNATKTAVIDARRRGGQMKAAFG